MSHTPLKVVRRARRRRGLRKRIIGVPDRPRLTVFRSARHIYAQIIDDLSGRTLASASTMEKQARNVPTTKRKSAEQVGQAIAQRAVNAGVTQIAFDRNGYRYHGRVRALADAARKGGLSF